ncbi:MAG: hypothetical protein ACLTK0_08115 [Anaerovoracaceae bacterium]
MCRNLTAGEIAEQIIAAERDTGERVNHVVVMGTGEPFDNYENLSRFIKIINDKAGKNLGMRNITVSTCGLVPMIGQFAKDFPQVNLAISLHAPNDEIRSGMMPVNGKYPLKELIGACRRYTETTSRRITFEYTRKRRQRFARNAMQLAELLKGMLCHVNLIPLNKVKETALILLPKRKRRSSALLEDAISYLARAGDDIDGACGQLRLKGKNKFSLKRQLGYCIMKELNQRIEEFKQNLFRRR